MHKYAEESELYTHLLPMQGAYSTDMYVKAAQMYIQLVQKQLNEIDR